MKLSSFLPEPSFRDILKARWSELPAQDEKDDYMARKLSTILPAKSSGPSFTPVEVPKDVASELTALYKHLREHTDERGLAEFDDTDEKALFVRQAQTWAREQEVRFRITKPSGEASETTLQFILAPPFTEDELAARAEAQAKRKAKEAAKATAS